MALGNNMSFSTDLSTNDPSAHPMTPHQRGMEKLTVALGRPWTVYVTLAGVALWIVVNFSLAAWGFTTVDPPPFHGLHIFVSLLALLVTLIILTTENRQVYLAEQRSHLDLQVNLLAEKKIAKVVALLEELRRDLPTVRNRLDQEAQEMSEPADPQVVAKALGNQTDHLPL
jgi:uncharacterized membrane protein